jgi:hypothetical protein
MAAYQYIYVTSGCRALSIRSLPQSGKYVTLQSGYQ